MNLPTASQLCYNCRVLEFDDAAAGGADGVGAGGNPYLRMPMSSDGKCWKLDLDPYRPVRDSLPDLPSLASSAQSGCGFCAFLRASILSEETARESRLNPVLTQEAEGGVDIWRHYQWIPDTEEYQDAPPGQGFLTLVVMLMPDCLNEEFNFVFRVEFTNGDPSLAAWLRISPSPRIQHRLSPECVAWAKSAIEHCCRDHKDHDTGRLEPFCPKRLIDVQSEPVRLALATDMLSPLTATPQYAALSYCWGPEDEARTQLKTICDSLSERLSGISADQMTPVLRDAVDFTRALAIPYLWVDALCILQDCDERSDWEEQSSVMDKIYAYAHVTLGALASDSCTKRFCSPAQPELHVRLRSSLRPSVTGLLKVTSHQRYVHDPADYSATHIIEANERNSVWSSRAWTLQEQLMSTRFVGFGKQDLFFTCPSSQSIMGGRRYPPGYWAQVGVSGQIWGGFAEWKGVVMDYSHRLEGLSRPSDALPALSGIAASFCKAMGLHADDYVVGLWRPNLFAGVAWQLVAPRSSREVRLADAVKRAACPGESRTPSWSWVSRGKVEIQDLFDNKPMCQIKSRVVRSGKNPFGEIVGASLRITGKFCKLPSDLEKLEGALSHLPHLSPWKADDGTHQWWFWIDWAPNRSPEPAGELKMILTGTSSPRKGTLRRFFGLLIHEVGAARPGVFVRVGNFESSPYIRRSARRFFNDCTTESVEIV